MPRAAKAFVRRYQPHGSVTVITDCHDRTGCLRGLQTGEGPRAVGESATRSVVTSILLIILADAIIASVTYTLRR